MRFPRSGIGLLLMSFLLCPLATQAGELRSGPRPLPPGPIIHETIGTVMGGPACNLGHDGVPQRMANLLTPPSDRYYLYIEPSQCAECSGNNRARILSATVTLHFKVTCTVPVTAYVVAVAGADTCLVPNENVRLCAPVLANLSGNAGETKQFEIAMSDSCEFGDRAFLGFNFFSDGDSCASDTTRPEIVFGDPPCPLCNIWNIFVSPPDKDLCFDDPLGLPVMYATVSSCYTPTIPRSWGSLKAIYRRSR